MTFHQTRSLGSFVSFTIDVEMWLQEQKSVAALLQAAGCELEVPPRKKHGGGYCRSSCRRAAHAVTRMLLSCLDHLYGTDLIGVSLSSGKITNRLVGVFASYTCGFPSPVRGSCFSGTVYWFESQSKLVF